MEGIPLSLLGTILAAFVVAGSDQPTAADGHEQKQGPAILRIVGDKMEEGRVEVRLSSLVHVTLTVEGPETLEVEAPAVLTQSKFWKVLRAPQPEKVALPDKRTRWTQQFTLDPENQGDLPLQIAPLRHRLEAGKGDWQTAAWKEVPIRVTTTVVRVDPSQLRDITGPEQLPEEKSPWIPVLNWSGIVLVALALLLGAFELKRRLTPPKPELAPHEWAARELDRLDTMSLPQHGQADRFHTLLSDTIRRYLELRFHLRAPRQTTAEFLEAMRQSPNLNADQRNLLREFLERCDLAKFARAEYSVAESHATAAMARTFVEQTKPSPVPAAPATPARS